MAQEEVIKQFEASKIRVVWDSETEKYYFSVIDVVQVLTDSADARTYWKVLKNRLIKEGNETVTNCNQLKLTAADGKVARVAREELEAQTGRKVVSPLSAKRFFESQQPTLPLEEEKSNKDNDKD